MAQLVDNVIVIGKGKLIASTSIKGLLSDNTKSSVFVRANNLSKTRNSIKGQEISDGNFKDGLEVYGVKTDEIGKLAHQSDITIYELVTKNASLEEVFLELTEGKEEFQARIPKVGKS